MTGGISNVGASVRARLLQHSRIKNSNYQLLLTHYALERLLYRLSVSDQRDWIVLKGGMLIAVWRSEPWRPTRDINFLGYGEFNPTAVVEQFRSICSVDVPDDGFFFDVAGIKSSPIRNGTEKLGVRMKFNAFIDRARLPIRIDVGFGDVVTPRPIETEYPVLLDGPAPILQIYPPETVVAEKMAAIISHGMTNSRMKDFHDIWMIAETLAFEGAILSSAIQGTLTKSQTPWPLQMPDGLSDEYALEREAIWQAFLARDNIDVSSASLLQVIKKIRAFLQPVFERAKIDTWPPGGPWT